MPLLRDNYLLNETSENEYIFFVLYVFSNDHPIYLMRSLYRVDEMMTNHFSEESLQAAKLSETAKQAFLVPDSATTYLFVNALNIHSTSLMFASKK